MNALSALIYFVGVADGINILGLWLTIPGTLACIIVTVVWLVLSGCQMESSPLSDKDKAQFEFAWMWWKKGKNIAATMAVLGWLMLIFMPSRQTIILIAGSEIGGKVAQSAAVQSVVDPGLELVKTWIANETNKLQDYKKDHKKEDK